MKKNNIKPIRFTPELMEKIRAKAPHLNPNFSAQVKYLIQVGLAKSESGKVTLREQPLELGELKKAIHQANINLARIGNNLNQIAHHLNMGDSARLAHFSQLSNELKKEISEVRKFAADTVKQL